MTKFKVATQAFPLAPDAWVRARTFRLDELTRLACSLDTFSFVAGLGEIVGGRSFGGKACGVSAQRTDKVQACAWAATRLFTVASNFSRAALSTHD